MDFLPHAWGNVWEQAPPIRLESGGQPLTMPGMGLEGNVDGHILARADRLLPEIQVRIITSQRVVLKSNATGKYIAREPYDPPAYRIGIRVENGVGGASGMYWLTGKDKIGSQEFISETLLRPVGFDQGQEYTSDDVSWRFTVDGRKLYPPYMNSTDVIANWRLMNVGNNRWLTVNPVTKLLGVAISYQEGSVWKLIDSKAPDETHVPDKKEEKGREDEKKGLDPTDDDHWVARHIKWEWTPEMVRFGHQQKYKRPLLVDTVSFSGKDKDDTTRSVSWPLRHYMEEHWQNYRDNNGHASGWSHFWNNVESFFSKTPSGEWLAGMGFLRRKLQVLQLAKAVRPMVKPDNILQWYKLFEPAMCIFNTDPSRHGWQQCLALALGEDTDVVHGNAAPGSVDLDDANMRAEEFLQDQLDWESVVDRAEAEVMGGLTAFFHLDGFFNKLGDIADGVSKGIPLAMIAFAGVAAIMLLRH